MPEGPLRVCLAAWPFPPRFGGHGIQLHRNVPLLRALGIDVTVLTTRPDPSQTGAPAPDDAVVHRVLSAGPGRLSGLRRALEIRRWFAANAGRFDVVHCASLQWDVCVNVPFIRGLGTPLVAESVLLASDDPLTIETDRRFGAWQLRMLQPVDAWIGISRAFLPRFRASSFSEEKFRLIHQGVDTAAYRRRSAEERAELRPRLGLPRDARVAVSVGAVIERKGVDRLLRAWAAMRPDPDRDRLVVVGPTSVEEGLAPSEYGFSREMLALAEQVPLAGTVSFPGRSECVADFMAAADLFVLLSRQEGFGTVAAEAMCSGLPVLLSPMDGIGDELISNGGEGLIAEDPDDAESVAGLIEQLLRDEPRRRRMGEAGRIRAVGRFSIETRARALATLYREIVDRERTRRAA